MDSNLRIFLAEFEKLKGQFVITESYVVERLIAIGCDEQDYYYVTYNGKTIVWNTCVGRIIPLKGMIEEEHYNRFITLAKFNHQDQPTIFGCNPDDYATDNGKEILYEGKPFTYRELANMNRKKIETLTKPDHYLTDICWDLN